MVHQSISSPMNCDTSSSNKKAKSFLHQLISLSQSKLLSWHRDDVYSDNITVQFSSSITANNEHLILTFYEDFDEGEVLLVKAYGNKSFYTKTFKEKYFIKELDLLFQSINVIDKQYGYFDNISKLTPYERNPKRELNARGLKAQRLLENVNYSHETLILGE